jgi:hypothetical protein
MFYQGSRTSIFYPIKIPFFNPFLGGARPLFFRMRKVAIIFNKGWELEPGLAAMCSPEFRPANLPKRSPLSFARQKSRQPVRKIKA